MKKKPAAKLDDDLRSEYDLSDLKDGVRGKYAQRVNDLPVLIGKAIHHCGALEFFVNNSICDLAKDDLLAEEVLTYPFSKRINFLRKLLTERSEVEPTDIKGLCKELDNISKMRNRVAHNPIVSDDPDMKAPYILIVKKAPHEVNKISNEDVKKFVKQTCETMVRMTELIPSCTKCGNPQDDPSGLLSMTSVPGVGGVETLDADGREAFHRTVALADAAADAQIALHVRLLYLQLETVGVLDRIRVDNPDRLLRRGTHLLATDAGRPLAPRKATRIV